MNFWRVNKYYFTRLKRLRGSPKALAGGIAIGVFVGLTPTIPFHTVLIIAFALMTRMSVIAGIIVSWLVCNPLTYLPIYYLSAKIGNYVTPYDFNLEKVKTLLDHVHGADSLSESLKYVFASGYEALVVMIVGGVCLGLPCAVASYYLALRFFVRLQKKRIAKKILN
ncbi:MAG: DUF2062 domain-containing protein [Desulforhopalus sp.]